MLFVYHDNCNQSYVSGLADEGENSTSSLWYVILPRPRMDHSFFIIFLCILRLIALLANCLALLVFLLNKNLPIRRSLMALSSAEVFLCFCSFLRNLLELVTTGGAGVAGGRALLHVYDIASIISFSALITRNWIIVMITASKCDALLRPLQWRQGQLWHQRYETLLFALIALISTILAVFYDFLSIPQYCSADGRLLSVYFPLGRTLLDSTSNLFFIIQSPLPVFSVLILCTIIIVFIQLRKYHLTTDSIATDSRTQLALTRHTDQATVLSLALALTFIPLELPAFVANYYNTSVFGHISNVCVALDSLGNFFLYSCLNRHFRERCRHLCRSPSNRRTLRIEISSNPPPTYRLTSQISSPAPGSINRLSGNSANNVFLMSESTRERIRISVTEYALQN